MSPGRPNAIAMSDGGDHAVLARLRRDLALATALRWALLLAATAAVLSQAVPGLAFAGSVALAVVAGLWLVLSYFSARGSRAASITPSLIAAGEYEEAQQSIDEALRAFSLFRTVKLRSLHHLALLRHAQRRWAEAAMLSRALLAQRLGPLWSAGRSARLVLAESMLELGDVHGAYEALDGLYGQDLPLAEALELTALQADYLSSTGQWRHLMQDAGRKAALAELMPGPRSAQTQALLALAARKLGLGEWERWLRRRVELLAEREELVSRRPVLAELWDGA